LINSVLLKLIRYLTGDIAATAAKQYSLPTAISVPSGD